MASWFRRGETMSPEEKAQRDIRAVEEQIRSTRETIKGYERMRAEEQKRLDEADAQVNRLVQLMAKCKQAGKTGQVNQLRGQYQPLRDKQARAKERLAFHDSQIRLMEKSIDNLQDALLSRTTQEVLKANTRLLPNVSVNADDTDDTLDKHDEATDDVSEVRRRMNERRGSEWDSAALDLDAELDGLVNEFMESSETFLEDGDASVPVVPDMPPVPTTPLGGGGGGIRIVSNSERKKELLAKIKK